MKQVVLTKFEPVDKGERSVRALDLGNRDRAVEGDHGAWRYRQQLVVQLQNLQPIRRGGVWRVAMDSLDCCLNLVRTRPVVPKATPYKSLPFGDQLAIPPAAVLIGQQDQVAVQTYPRVSARFDEQHQREQPQDLRFPGHQIRQEPSEADGLRAEILANELLA